MIFSAFIILLLFFGALFISIEIVKIQSKYYKSDKKKNYKYITRTFEEEQENPITISDIFDTMFSQPSPWVGSIRNYDLRKHDEINKYFVTQM